MPASCARARFDPFEDGAFTDYYWARSDDVSQQNAAALEDPLVEWFDAVEDALLSDPAIDELPNVRSATRDDLLARFSIDWDDLADLLEELAGPTLAPQVEDAMHRALEDLGVNPEQVDDLTKWQQEVVDESTRKIREPVDTVKAEVQKLLSKLAGKTPEEIAEGFASQFDGYRTGRVKTIAQTTATFTTGASQLAAWDGMGVSYRWLSMRDGRVRDSHRAADGQAPDAEGYFAIGSDRMTHPGAGSQAKENVNCRCVLRPHFPDERTAYLPEFTRTVYDPWAESQSVD